MQGDGEAHTCASKPPTQPDTGEFVEPEATFLWVRLSDDQQKYP